MPSQSENLSLGRELVNKIAATSICSNDIIDRAEMPVVLPSEFESYRRIFGRARFQLFLDYTRDVTSIRQTINILCKKHRMAPLFTQTLAIAKLGYGECQERASRITADILKRDRTDIVTVLIAGMPDMRYGGSVPYLHAVVILGLTESEKTMLVTEGVKDLTNLSRLNKTAVVIDPLRKHVGLATDYARDQAKYLKPMGYSILYEVRAFSRSHCKGVSEIEAQADEVVKAVISKGVKPVSDVPKYHAIIAPRCVRIFDVKASQISSEQSQIRFQKWLALRGNAALPVLDSAESIQRFFVAPLDPMLFPSEDEEALSSFSVSAGF